VGLELVRLAFNREKQLANYATLFPGWLPPVPGLAPAPDAAWPRALTPVRFRPLVLTPAPTPPGPGPDSCPPPTPVGTGG